MLCYQLPQVAQLRSATAALAQLEITVIFELFLFRRSFLLEFRGKIGKYSKLEDKVPITLHSACYTVAHCNERSHRCEFLEWSAQY